MADQIRVSGMILSSRPQGENDKRVVILTKEFGKVTAFAHGARRPGNHLMAASDSCACGTFFLVRGKDAYSMVGAEIKDYFRELIGDLTTTYTAYYFLELAEYYAVENQGAGPMLNLLYLALKALLNPALNKQLVRYCYELKLMVLNGEYPDFFTCGVTGSRENLAGFSIAHSSVVCAEAMKLAPDAVSLGATALYALQFIVKTPISKLYSFDVSEEALAEIRMVCDRCRHAYIDRNMKSLEILETLT